jgi:hypothetical protein
MKGHKLCGVIVTVIFLLTAFISCEKIEGEGGTSTISGKVRVVKLVGEQEYYAQEERVYIIYGDDITHSDDVRTNFDGTFRFSYLRQGTYHVYAYSKDTTGNYLSGDMPVIKTVEITKHNQHIEVDDIIIFD